MVGSLFIIIQTGLLGSLEFVDETHAFIVLSFVAQVLGGLGAGANSTASMAIIGSFSKQEREKYLGLIQGSNGLGLLAGPLFGALMFQIGGFAAPFITFAVLYLSFYPFMIYNLAVSNRSFMQQSPSLSPRSGKISNSTTRGKVKLRDLFQRARFFFGVWCQMNLLMSL